MKLIVKARSTFALLGCTLFILAAQSTVVAANFSGSWSIGGTMVTGSVLTKVSAVCSLRQSGDAISGSCRGANGGGSASGVVNGSKIYWQLRVTASNAQGLTALTTFHGTLGSDNVIRGTWTVSARPGGTGTFTAIRS
jgi:hypothetical protein